jgi:opacity protein-like surface antigen
LLSHRFLKIALSSLLAGIAIPVLSQTVPGATEGHLPLVVGIGYSEFQTDWSGRLGGPSIWADWNFNQLPGKLHGLGVEVNARDLNFNRSGSDPRLRMDVAEGGPIYTWRRDRPFRPYVKFLAGLGSIDFTLPNYFHDTRTVYSPAGGIDYRFSGHFVVRVDYEYQFWTHFINDHTMNPQGLTIGINYDLGHPRRFE